jgi:ATP-dependent Clp protease ATP-binding subunit ClpA
MNTRHKIEHGADGAKKPAGARPSIGSDPSPIGVNVVRVDRDTVLLEAVPVDSAAFSKSGSNLLIRRHRLSGRYMVFVDADLECTAMDAARRRALHTHSEKNGWRPLLLREMPATFAEAARGSFELLGTPPLDPVLQAMEGYDAEQTAAGDDDFFRRHTQDLAERALRNDCLPIIGRDAELRFILATLRKREFPRLSVVTGPSGSGKSTVLLGVAALLVRPWRSAADDEQATDGGMRLVELDHVRLFTGALFPGEREDGLKRVLDAVRPDCVLAIEDLHAFASLCPKGLLLLERALDSGMRIVATARCMPDRASLRASFRRRCVEVPLTAPDPLHCFRILQAMRDDLERHHDVVIPEAVLRFVIGQSADLPGALPAKAIDLLDTTCAMLDRNDNRALALDDVLGSIDICRCRDDGLEIEEAPDADDQRNSYE